MNHNIKFINFYFDDNKKNTVRVRKQWIADNTSAVSPSKRDN